MSKSTHFLNSLENVELERISLVLFFFYFIGRCSREKLYFAGLDPVTFEIRKEVSLEFSEVISDMAVEQDAQGTVYLVMSQPTWGVLIYSFNGDYLRFHQVIELDR